MSSHDVSASSADELISPVTTDSMVTVALSDRQSSVIGDEDEPGSIELPTTPVAEKEDDYFSQETEGEADTTPKNESTIKLAVATLEGDALEGDNHCSTELEPEKSSNPPSPTGSDGVDWEKLDKTEEQEPRTDTSDEVGIVVSNRKAFTDFFCIVNRFVARSLGTREQCSCYRSEISAG
jgi:hypothetical protein